MKNLLKRVVDILGGLFLLLTGIFLLFLYLVLRTKADNWFISFLLILFLIGLGFGGIILGVRRIFLAFRSEVSKE